MRVKNLIFGISLAVPTLVLALAHIRSTQAEQHVGETDTVCGEVAEVHYAARSRGRPTFLDFDQPYPDQDFVVVVWGRDAARFGNLTAYDGKDVCASGLIQAYRGVPEIVATERRQLTP